jgi:hypothetical protein
VSFRPINRMSSGGWRGTRGIRRRFGATPENSRADQKGQG